MTDVAKGQCWRDRTTGTAVTVLFVNDIIVDVIDHREQDDDSDVGWQRQRIPLATFVNEYVLDL